MEKTGIAAEHLLGPAQGGQFVAFDIDLDGDGLILRKHHVVQPPHFDRDLAGLGNLAEGPVPLFRGGCEMEGLLAVGKAEWVDFHAAVKPV